MMMSVSSALLAISYLVFCFFCSTSFFTTTVDGRKMIATMAVHHAAARKRNNQEHGNGSAFGMRRDDNREFHSDYFSDRQVRNLLARGGHGSDASTRRNSPSFFGLPHAHQQTPKFGQHPVPDAPRRRGRSPAPVDVNLQKASANTSQGLEAVRQQLARSVSEGRRNSRGSHRRDTSPPNPRDAHLARAALSVPIRRSLSVDSMPQIDERRQSVHDVDEHIRRHQTMDLNDVGGDDVMEDDLCSRWSMEVLDGKKAKKGANKHWFCGPCGSGSPVMDD